MIRSFRKPAIVFTPKSMLRHPECQSSISEFIGKSKFQEILDDTKANVGQVTKVLFCSGKLYYDLLAYRKKNNIEHTAIVRLEQLYPLRKDVLQEIKQKYTTAKKFIWVQEEPANMGAWTFIKTHFPEEFEIGLLAREESSVTATGFIQQHTEDQKQLVEDCFSSINI